MKTVLVTGGTSGIGRVAARELKAKGFRVVVVGRDPQRLKAMNGFETIQADLSLVRETRRAAREFRERIGTLDVLLNNAGAIYGEYGETAEGIERTFALDHLAYFVMTEELLPLLRESRGRVVSVSSDAHKAGRLDFDDLQLKRRFSGARQYCNAKLMNILFARELARREPDITSNALHPGAIASGFGMTGAAGRIGWIFKLARPFLISEEKGAQTSIWAASDPSLDGVTGKYFVKKRVRNPIAAARSDENARRLWEATEVIVRGIPPSP
ncbi:MAG TPA: SDR family NAD(P)-dependent oxidoreductase [Myxococcales bacterium]|jgi:NAD(P)-dependent dehydrogenase (short-subunit alcohol dehydrogenase family)